jgi:hypothetical protein
MSVITSVVILASILEEDSDVVEELEAYFSDERAASHDPAHCNALTMKIDGASVGGWSVLQGTLFAGAWNHLDDVGFLRHLRDNVLWRERETVRVFINREHDEGWHEVILWPELTRPAVLTIDEMAADHGGGREIVVVDVQQIGERVLGLPRSKS